MFSCYFLFVASHVSLIVYSFFARLGTDFSVEGLVGVWRNLVTGKYLILVVGETQTQVLADSMAITPPNHTKPF